MLAHLHIQNFVIIENIELDFKHGLTVITGETGAGKSIIIDALSLVLGARSDSNCVGNYQDKCSITACFEIEDINEAKEWLKQNEYGESPWNECIIRRILHKDGKTRQTINGYNCTLQQLKELMPLIISIHSQNQHQLLCKRSHQRDLLDSYANQQTLCDTVKERYFRWFDNVNKMEQLKALQQNSGVKQELLTFQIEEFEKMALLPDEYDALDRELKQLSNADQLLRSCHDALNVLSESEQYSAEALLYQAQQYLTSIKQFDETLTPCNELITQAIIHLEEAVSELRNFVSRVEINPNRLHQVEQRLSKLHDLARKYQVKPHALGDVQLTLSQQLNALNHADSQYQILQEQSLQLLQDYQQAAQALHEKRNQAALLISKKITHDIQQLGMPGGAFKIDVTKTDEVTPHGFDHIDFLVATNPGQSLQPLAKIASGGETSRIALAIYTATAQKKTTPILVFDEVDVGIGGGTAAIVGRLLKTLSKSAQVFCITHLPQVAAYGDHHFQVQKHVAKQQTVTHLMHLQGEDRVQEIARMLGGMTITDKTLAHAKELMAEV